MKVLIRRAVPPPASPPAPPANALSAPANQRRRLIIGGAAFFGAGMNLTVAFMAAMDGQLLVAVIACVACGVGLSLALELEGARRG